MFGWTADEIRHDRSARLVPPDRRDEVQAILASVRQGETVRRFRTQRLHTDGSLVDVSTTLSPIIDDTGQVAGAAESHPRRGPPGGHPG